MKKVHGINTLIELDSLASSIPRVSDNAFEQNAALPNEVPMSSGNRFCAFCGIYEYVMNTNKTGLNIQQDLSDTFEQSSLHPFLQEFQDSVISSIEKAQAILMVFTRRLEFAFKNQHCLEKGAYATIGKFTKEARELSKHLDAFVPSSQRYHRRNKIDESTILEHQKSTSLNTFQSELSDHKPENLLESENCNIPQRVREFNAYDQQPSQNQYLSINKRDENFNQKGIGESFYFTLSSAVVGKLRESGSWLQINPICLKQSFNSK